WAEYIKNEKKIEYTIFPRMAALSEVLWSPKSIRNFKEFEKRLITQFKRYELWDANYSSAYFDLALTVTPGKNNQGINLALASKLSDGKISYQLGKDPKKITYSSPLPIQTNATLNASLYYNNVLRSSISQKVFINKATGKQAILTNKPSGSYPGDGAFTLVNGIQNTKGLASSGEFLGFNGEDCEVVIDLVETQNVSTINVHSYHQPGSWIYKPAYVQVWTSV